MTLDPGHFHAALIQKEMYPGVAPRVDVYAPLGWDLVDPIPLYEYREPRSLHAHVRFENSIAEERGALMPPQKDVRSDEIDELWIWMKAIARSGPRPYLEE